VGAEDLKHKKCEDCQLKRSSYGLPSEGKKRWCWGCAKAHAGAVSAGNNCEDCGLKVPSFGLASEGKRRWCAGCAKGHAGAVDVANKECEGCGLKQPPFGMPSEGKRRWCSGCAKGHAGAENLKHTAGLRRTQARGSPQKKPKVTDGWTLHFHLRS
jgi:hypothetical protein